jgi:hypothetical protein
MRGVALQGSGSVGNHSEPMELEIGESQRKSELAALYGALAQVTRDFVKERLISCLQQLKVFYIPWWSMHVEFLFN